MVGPCSQPPKVRAGGSGWRLDLVGQIEDLLGSFRWKEAVKFDEETKESFIHSAGICALGQALCYDLI